MNANKLIKNTTLVLITGSLFLSNAFAASNIKFTPEATDPYTEVPEYNLIPKMNDLAPVDAANYYIDNRGIHHSLHIVNNSNGVPGPVELGIFYSKSGDGKNWSPAENLYLDSLPLPKKSLFTSNSNKSYKYIYLPQVIACNSNVMVTYTDGNYDGINAHYSRDSGSTWSTSTKLPSEFGSFAGPFVYDQNCNLFHIYHGEDRNLYLAKSIDGGRSWGNITPVTNYGKASNPETTPSIYSVHVDKNSSNVISVYYIIYVARNSRNHYDINDTSFVNGSWTSPKVLHTVVSSEDYAIESMSIQGVASVNNKVMLGFITVKANEALKVRSYLLTYNGNESEVYLLQDYNTTPEYKK